MTTDNTLIAHQPPSLIVGGNGIIQNSGCGDNPAIAVRKVADGTIANASTALTAQIDDGLINIQGCTTFSMWYSFVLGSLTNATIVPKFLYEIGGTEYSLKLFDVTAGSGTIALVTFALTAMTATDAGVICLPNPGANYLKFYASSTGTITSSSLLLYVTRGFGHVNMPSV